MEVINQGGAPTKYKTIYNKQAKKLCLLGCTDKEIAEFFDVSESTLNKWKLEHTGFSESLRASKLLPDAEVASCLYKRAIGFYYDEVTFEKVSVSDSLNEENIKKDAYKKKVVRKYVIPDVGAQTLWLKNRQKDKWRDKVDFDYEKLPEHILDEIITRLKNSLT